MCTIMAYFTTTERITVLQLAAFSLLFPFIMSSISTHHVSILKRNSDANEGWEQSKVALP